MSLSHYDQTLLRCRKDAVVYLCVTTESFLAINTTDTQSVCTADSNDIRSAEPEGAKVILTIPENVDERFLECSVLVNLLKPTRQSTFAEYARTVFVLKVTKELQTVERVDIVYDKYKKVSLKGTTQ